MIYAILGTTASGKTDLALELARRYVLPLIGADAYQIYREFQIGTARPLEEDLAGVRHHLIGSHTIKAPINVKEYQRECRKLLDYYLELGQDVILSGGTFLYVKAALFDYHFPDEEEDDYRYRDCSDSELYHMLEEREPTVAINLHPNNRRRVLRAIINLDNQKDLNKGGAEKLLYPAVFLAIDRGRDETIERIDQRVDQMMGKGLIKEVKGLLIDRENLTSAFQAIGYKEVREGLSLGWGEKKIAEKIAIRTRQYAKRQRTFLRHQFPQLLWAESERISSLVGNSLEKKVRSRAALGASIFHLAESCRALVVGLGGVGAMVASGLARLGVHRLTILDQDQVVASNLNRQILYEENDIGQRKVLAAARHLLAIDPLCQVETIDIVLSGETIKTLDPTKIDFIFDCIDDVEAKIELIRYAVEHNIPLITCCGTGRKVDSTRVRWGTLDQTGDPLAKALKRGLKAAGVDIATIPAVFSLEPAQKADHDFISSLVTVPNAAGLAMISYFIDYIRSSKRYNHE